MKLSRTDQAGDTAGRSVPVLDLNGGLKLLGAAALALSLAACASGGGQRSEASGAVFQSQTAGDRGGGFSLPGFGRGRADANAGAALGVNSFLWRATLDTLAFMPLQSADPYGGVIITDWYANPEKPDERFKVTVYILDTRLRADGLNVSVFKETRDPAGQWANAPVAGQTETDLENQILTRARQLRLSSLGARG